MKNVFMLALIVPLLAFGADAAVPELGFIDGIIQFFKDLGAGPMFLMITAAVDFIFRMMKTSKPLSLAHLFAAGMKKVAQALVVIAEFLDKVLPQRLQ